MKDELEDLLPKNRNKSTSKHKELLGQLKDIEDESFEEKFSSSTETTSSFLPSSMLKEQKKKKKDADVYDPDVWFNDLLATRPSKVKRNKVTKDLFDSAGINGKKKKKKKGEKTEATDFKREFEPEMALYKNLLMDQNRFTESLQKQYDYMCNTKSSARGINKQMTDLILNITSARQLAMQLVEKNVNAKKVIADLTLKQRKELGLGGAEGENMADFASTYLKQMLSDRKSIINATNADVSEYTDDELFNELNTSLSNSEDDDDRAPEVDQYLKYENSGVKVYVHITDDDVENYEFVAKDTDGNEIFDYPLPMHTSISVNRSTGCATDIYGKKYQIIFD